MRHPFRPSARAPLARVFVVAIVATLAIPVPGSSSDGPHLELPDGFRVVHARAVAPGVVHFRVSADGQRINVARIAPGAARPVVARARASGGMARTSHMCARRRCLVGVNGDFFYRHGRPAGAVVVHREPWITRRFRRPHLVVGRDGSFRTSRVDIPLRIRVRYPHPNEDFDRLAGTNLFHGETSGFKAHSINTRRKKDRLVVYTERAGSRTRTGRTGVELITTVVSKSHRLALRHTTELRVTGMRERGNATIPDRGVVLSGRGSSADALRALWQDVRAGRARRTIRLSVGGPRGADQVIGGRPVLIRDGEIVAPDNDWFSYWPHARTVAGWTSDGTLYLVTIDLYGAANGMSLERAARFMRALGCVGAINLDGGSSTTFVRRGRLRNTPAAGGEHRVGSALLIVRG